MCSSFQIAYSCKTQRKNRIQEPIQSKAPITHEQDRIAISRHASQKRPSTIPSIHKPALKREKIIIYPNFN